MSLASAKTATLAGCLAIVFWSTNIAFSRSLSEQLGPFSAGAVVYLVAGLVGCGVLVARRQLGAAVRQAHPAYLFGCGSLMVVYTACLFAAVGLAADRAQVATATVANYLWPSLTLLLSVPMLGVRAHAPLLGLSTLTGIAGVTLTLGPLAPGQTHSTGWEQNLGPAGFGLLAALFWACYSNVARRWGPTGEGGAMALFLLITGLVLLALRTVRAEESHWVPGLGLEILAMALFPTWLAYVFWDAGVRRGNLPLLASTSYLIPALSLAVSWLYLDLETRPTQWMGVGLVSAAAFIGHRACAPRIPEKLGRRATPPSEGRRS